MTGHIGSSVQIDKSGVSAVAGLRTNVSARTPAALGTFSQLLLLALAMAAGGYARTIVSPLQEAIRLALSLSDNEIALLQGPALGIPLAIAAIPLGFLIDRYSRARLLLGLTVLNLTGSFATALVTKFTLLFGARCLVGLAGYATVPVVLSLLADHYPPAQRGRATMVVSVGQVAGNSAAFALGGFLLGAAGSHAEGWRWAMVWLTTPLIAVTIFTMLLREPLRTDTSLQRPSVIESIVELWVFRSKLVPLLLGYLMVETAIGAVLVWSAPTFSRTYALSPTHIGAIMATALLVSGLLGPVVGGIVGDLSQRVGGPRLTGLALAAFAALASPAGIFPILDGAVSAGVFLVVFLTISLAIAVMGLALFTIVIPNELRGLCISLVVAINIMFAIGFAPVVVSLLSGAIGGISQIGVALALTCVTTSILASGCFAFARTNLPQVAGETQQ